MEIFAPQDERVGPGIRRPFVVVWRVLDRCNLSCPFCAYDKRLEFPRSMADEAEVARMVDLFAAWQTRMDRPVLISWLGGEPTLWEAFDRITEWARAAGLMQSLTTNGTTLGAPKMRAKMLDRFDEITVSVDGFAAFHDDMRGWRGAFAKLERGVRALAREKAAQGATTRLKANVVLMRGNVGTFPALARRLAAWGIEDITYNQLGGRDRPEFFSDNRLTVAQVALLQRMMPGLRAELAARGVTLLGGDPYLERFADAAQDVPLPVTGCQVAREFLFIDEAGVMAPCNFVGNRFGVTTRGIRTVEDLAQVPDQLCLAQARRPSAACRNCMSTQQVSKFSA